MLSFRNIAGKKRYCSSCLKITRISTFTPERRKGAMPYPAFDRSRLRLQPLQARQHDLDLSVILSLEAPLPEFHHPALPILGRCLVDARRHQRTRLMLMGAHVIRAGVSKFLIELMERGLL